MAEKIEESKTQNDKKKKQFNVKELAKYFNQRVFYGILLVGVLMLVVSYVFVYLDYQIKTEEKEASNEKLRAQVEVLEDYYNNMDQYVSETNQMVEEIGQILSAYPADAKEEDMIMLAVNLQEQNAISYHSINMEEKETVYDIPSQVVTPAQIAGFDRNIQFIRKHASYSNVTNYDELKGCLETIFNSPNRLGIDNIVYVKNEEDGTLEGNINLYFYSATGTGKEYTAPDIAQYLAGTRDIFRLDKVVKHDAQEQQDKQENVEGTEETTTEQ